MLLDQEEEICNSEKAKARGQIQAWLGKHSQMQELHPRNRSAIRDSKGFRKKKIIPKLLDPSFGSEKRHCSEEKNTSLIWKGRDVKIHSSLYKIEVSKSNYLLFLMIKESRFKGSSN